jgi:hypothetical protein
LLPLSLFLAVFFLAAPAFAQSKARCTSVQAKCVVENGGRCDMKTGRWQIGGRAGGSHRGYLDCLGKIYSKNGTR